MSRSRWVGQKPEGVKLSHVHSLGAIKYGALSPVDHATFALGDDSNLYHWHYEFGRWLLATHDTDAQYALESVAEAKGENRATRD